MELERKATLADATIERTLQLVGQLLDDSPSSMAEVCYAIEQIADDWRPISDFVEFDDCGAGNKTDDEILQLRQEIRDPDMDDDEIAVEMYNAGREAALSDLRETLKKAFERADAAHTTAIRLAENHAIEVDHSDLDDLERDLIVAQIPIRGTSANG
jgi:hypothetical protein